MAHVLRPHMDNSDKTVGRPSSYCAKLADEVLERLACGESLRMICRDDAMPHRATVVRWLSKHEHFQVRYTIARQIQADMWRDEIYDLAKMQPPVDPVTGRVDPGAVAHIRNQVGTLRWLAVKLLPKR